MLCLVCLRTHGHHWYLDIGCSRYMMGDKSQFFELLLKEKGHVTYDDNNQEKILGVGKIGNASQATIDNVLYMEGLEHTLLNISQLCGKGNKVPFDSNCFLIHNGIDNKVKFIGHQINNISMVDLEESDIGIWHRKTSHIHLEHLEKLSSKDLLIGLPKGISNSCQKCKQVKNYFSSKRVVSTTWPLELLHMYLFGIMSFVGSYYALVIFDDFSRLVSTFFLVFKKPCQTTSKPIQHLDELIYSRFQSLNDRIDSGLASLYDRVSAEVQRQEKTTRELIIDYLNVVSFRNQIKAILHIPRSWVEEEKKVRGNKRHTSKA
ncbi:hypothetical protein Lal_00042929 [Lupinus albus]|nr:hypothetical protein Lal_00042929 [Lupinus albus]